jgi:hypothetical protein
MGFASPPVAEPPPADGEELPLADGEEDVVLDVVVVVLQLTASKQMLARPTKEASTLDLDGWFMFFFTKS